MNQTEGAAAWMLGLLGTITLGWVGSTSKKTQENCVKIAVLETDVKYIKAGMERIEDHFGTRPKE